MSKKIQSIIFLLLISILMLSSCSKSDEEVKNIEMEVEKISYNFYATDFGLAPCEIIIPKNQTVSQSLSIVVTDDEDNLIVFDGGRVEDADYLTKIIKDKGGKVKTWYLTHIHDDHIGALYEIMNKKKSDITIENLVYDFADFEWYYEKMGDDAGIYYLFEDALREYNNFLVENGKEKINIINDLSVDEKKVYKYKDANNSDVFTVYVLNNLYKLDQDPINNTSIAYFVQFANDASMIIFGDLGYEGGYKLFEDLETSETVEKDLVYRSDIIVLSHHGQGGIDPILYNNFEYPQIIIWPTSKDIYENRNKKYDTDNVKKVLKDIDSIEKEIKSYEDTYALN